MRHTSKMGSKLASAVTAALAALCLASAIGPARAQQPPAAATPAAPDREALIRSAMSAAPPTLRATVKVMDFNGNVLRDGPSGFTCLPAPPNIAGPMCLDEVWMGWLDAWANRRPFTPSRAALAYMLAGDTAEGGASNINPFDEQPTAGNDWMVERNHVMIPRARPGNARRPAHGPPPSWPYVMWKGTPYAHIMMPVGVRPEQRRVTGR